MRAAAILSPLFVVALVACDSKKESSPAPSTRAAPEPVTQTSSPAPSAVASHAPPALSVSAAAAPSASAASSAASGNSPCGPNAKNYDEPKFCVTLPDKTLDVTYEGDANEGNFELEAKGGGVIRFSWVPLARAGKESLRAQVESPVEGYELVGSGDLPGGGAWSELKKTGSDEKTQHVVLSAVKTKKLLINCNYATTAENADKAREVCKSVKGY